LKLSLLLCSSTMPLPRRGRVVWQASIRAAVPPCNWYGRRAEQTTAGGRFRDHRSDVQMAEISSIDPWLAASLVDTLGP
jgi:hypothetical protein